jgi:hypothetical protein
MRRTDGTAGALCGRSDAVTTLLDRRRREGLVVPDYEGYCFANVPGTVGDVLDVNVGRSLPEDALAGVGTDVSNVVVVVLDSLGWHRFHRDAGDHRFLRRIRERGTVTPLTSVASASTAPAITSVHTGVPPAEHGVLGCDVRHPREDTVIRPFPHEVRADVADGGDASTGTEPPVAADEVVAADPVYSAFEAAGVETAVVQPAETLGTAYADAAFGEASQVPYEGPSDGAARLREAVESADGRSYTYWYAPELDSATHDYGPDSGAYHDALGTLTGRLSRALYDELDPAVAAEALLVVTADHGTVPLDDGPESWLRVLDVDGVQSRLRVRNGTPVAPFGDPRLCHLAVEPGSEDAVVTAFEERGVTALTRREVAETGLFGPPGDTYDRVESRCGDVVVTDADRALVYPGMEKVASFAGIHGGLTPREVVVPFAAARLSELQ